MFRARPSVCAWHEPDGDLKTRNDKPIKVLCYNVDCCNTLESETVLAVSWPLSSASLLVCPGWHPYAGREAPERVSRWRTEDGLHESSASLAAAFYLISVQVAAKGWSIAGKEDAVLRFGNSDARSIRVRASHTIVFCGPERVQRPATGLGYGLAGFHADEVRMFGPQSVGADWKGRLSGDLGSNSRREFLQCLSARRRNQTQDNWMKRGACSKASQ